MKPNEIIHQSTRLRIMAALNVLDPKKQIEFTRLRAPGKVNVRTGGARAGADPRRIAPFLAACLAASSAGCGSAEQSATPGAVADAGRIDTGGAKLYFEVRGDHADAPLLVWLHGGPGGAERPLFRYFNGGLERHFLVVYYDQRGAGRSFDPNAPPGLLTIAQHVEDLGRVVEELQERYRRDRVFLAGHSWGAALGMLYAKSHPEKVAWLICVAPVVSIGEQHRREYVYDMQEAARRGDQSALRELAAIGPPPYQTPSPVIRL